VFLAVLAATVAAQATPARAEAGDPVGAFDTISIRLGGSPYLRDAPNFNWELSGWAADPDAPQQRVEVHIYVDGQRIGQTEQIFTGDPRPDVAAAFPYAGPSAGWHYTLDAADFVPHRICVYAINVGPGSNNTTLGCKDEPVGTSVADPAGNIDAITTTPGLLRIQGWAGDGDAPARTPVRVVLDGTIWNAIDAALDRPDVRTAFAAFRQAGGFDITLPVRPGEHILCVDVGNTGPNGFRNTSLGCTGIDIPDVQPPVEQQARGLLEPNPDSSVVHFVASGWAWNPAVNAPATVHLRSALLSQIYFTSTFDDTTQTGESRPDIAQAHPGAPDDTGFHADIYGSSFPLTAVRYVCAYVVDGATERFIGCQATDYG